MSNLLRACQMADIHPRRRPQVAARRPDSITDHLPSEGRRHIRNSFFFGVYGLDLVITPANIKISTGTRQTGTAGESITAGQAVYLKASDNKLWRADANESSAASAAIGIALHAALADQPLAYLGSDNDVLAMGAILTVNTCYVVSANPGGIAPIADMAAGWFLNTLGFAITTSTLKLRIFASGVAS